MIEIILNKLFFRSKNSDCIKDYIEKKFYAIYNKNNK